MKNGGNGRCSREALKKMHDLFNQSVMQDIKARTDLRRRCSTPEESTEDVSDGLKEESDS